MTDDKYNGTNRELLIRLDERLKAVQKDVRIMNQVHVTRLNDHSDRIQSLERTRSYQKGGAGLLALLAAAGGAIVTMFRH